MGSFFVVAGKMFSVPIDNKKVTCYFFKVIYYLIGSDVNEL